MTNTLKSLHLSQHKEISFEAVLNSISVLETSQIVAFMHEIGKIVAQRTAPTLPQQELIVLEKIANLVPQKLQERYTFLNEKLNTETISLEEHQELLKIVTKIEAKNLKKIELMIKLAQIRGVDLGTLSKQMSPYAE
jgi:hypothetical protein